MSPSRQREPRKTELDDDAHAEKVYSILTQGTYWVTHDNERVLIEDMAPPHALSALRKLVDYADAEMLGTYSPDSTVASPLGVALRVQAMGETLVRAELAHFGRRTQPVVVNTSRIRTSTVLAAVEEIEDEIATGEDTSKYSGPVDYAVRLAELINERQHP